MHAQDGKGRSALHVAAEYGKEKGLPVLLDRGAKLDARDNRGQTPLHSAVGNDKYIARRLLLSLGADMDAKDLAGKLAIPERQRRNYEPRKAGKGGIRREMAYY